MDASKAHLLEPEETSDLEWVTDEDRKHPGFTSWRESMRGIIYGHEPALTAWHWFKTGWDVAFHEGYCAGIREEQGRC